MIIKQMFYQDQEKEVAPLQARKNMAGTDGAFLKKGRLPN